MLELIFAFILFLCWGSFLNVVGYRLIRGTTLLNRSACPDCTHPLAWYDLLPVVSWIALKFRCRYCKAKISALYPLIELYTALVGILLIIYIDPAYWVGYFLFFSALIVTIRTDCEKMLISRYMTLGMIPIGIGLAFYGALPITVAQSVAGTIFGYAILWSIAYLFLALRKIEGLGQGDIDLLAMIGAFTGILGAWITLFIGAFLGSLVGSSLAIRSKRSDIKIPFGPFLATGALIYVFFQKFFIDQLF